MVSRMGRGWTNNIRNPTGRVVTIQKQARNMNALLCARPKTLSFRSNVPKNRTRTRRPFLLTKWSLGWVPPFLRIFRGGNKRPPARGGGHSFHRRPLHRNTRHTTVVTRSRPTLAGIYVIFKFDGFRRFTVNFRLFGGIFLFRV